jgi:hypothetical protein
LAVTTATALLGAAGIGAASSLLGKKQGTTTQNSAPWANSQGYLDANLQRTEHLFQNQSPYLGQSQGLMAQRAMQGSPLNQAAQQNNLQTLQGNYLSPDSNPYLKDTVNQAMDGARSKINSQFAGDNYGNSAHQEWLTKGLMGAAAPMYSDNYQAERQRQVGAQALAPTLANQDYADIGQLQAAGNMPWDQIQRYQSIAQGAGGMGGSQTQPYFTNPMANAMGFGIGGLGLYNAMNQGGLLGGSNPTYTGYGMQGDYQYG